MALNDLISWRNNRGLHQRMQDPFSALQQEMNRLFDSFWGTSESRLPQGTGMGFHFPSLDVRESDKGYRVTAELPGLHEDDVEINLRDNSLIISGEKKAEHEEKDENRCYSERSFGRFQRMIPLPVEIDPDKVEAKFDKGVLTVELPKNARAQEKTRRIAINSEKARSRH